MYTTRTDERGRLKLPADFHNFVQNQEKKLFVTSLDRKTVRIYFLEAWRKNEALLTAQRGSQAAKNILFTANELGAEVEMDPQGRVPLSAELRAELQIANNQSVRLYHNSGRIEILSDSEYKSQREKAVANPEADVHSMEEVGLL